MPNYKTISLLTTFSKVLQKIMHSKSSHYLQTNNILDQEQFGLGKGKSVKNAAIKLTDSVLKSVNQKMHVGGIFCDLTKASGSANHEIVLTKYFFFAFKEEQQTGSDSTQQTENKRVKCNSQIQPKIPIKTGTQISKSSQGVNFRAFVFHYLYKGPPT
jgi:hypothetical protein